MHIHTYMYIHNELETKGVVLGIILLNSAIFITKLYYNLI